MTVLAVSGLFGCLALLPRAEAKDDPEWRAQAAEERAQASAVEAKAAEEKVQELKQKLAVLGREAQNRQQEKEWLEGQVQEAANNKAMFQAIQRAQALVDQISADRSLHFEADQTLQFGDELVQFSPNSFIPTWKPEGRARLREFCQKLSQRLNARTDDGSDLHAAFTVQVEGHTDTTRCPGDPYCNWWISAARAAIFVALMQQDEYCPAGASMNLRPVGYADTRPPEGDPLATRQERRRISVRIVPNYRRFIIHRLM